MNGIPVQKATARQAGRYAAVAYQAVLEHSMFLFQGGIYHYETGGITGGHPAHVGFSIGNRRWQTWAPPPAQTVVIASLPGTTPPFPEPGKEGRSGSNTTRGGPAGESPRNTGRSIPKGNSAPTPSPPPR